MKISSVFDGNELPIDETFEKAKIILDRKKGFVFKFMRSPHFNDEPKYFHYVAYTKKSKDYPSFSGIGCSRDNNIAQMKSLTESIERYCMNFKLKGNFLTTSFDKMKYTALDPTSIAAFSESQLRKKKFEPFRVSMDSVFGWVQGVSLITGKEAWVPAQLVSLNYDFLKGEKIIRIPITNGAASGTSISGSVLRGVMELVERDAFMITYLNRLPRNRIITNDSDVEGILSLFARYKLEVHSFDITSDIEIPTILSIVIDKTGIGPVVCMGTKSHFDAKEALIGSIDEAALIRMHMRKVFATEKIKPRESDIMDHKDRVLYWSDLDMIRHLGFLLDTKGVKNLDEIKSRKGNVLSHLKSTIRILRQKNLETVVVDVTKSLINKYGFKATMTVIPELQPFYLIGKYPYFGGRRLYHIPNVLGYTDHDTAEKDLNKIPHPF